MTLSQTPIYNLGAVLEETGLPADTLRAWERRYGLPAPRRTPGGHRLYSERDIALVRWLMSRRAEGMSISRAVAEWRHLTAAGGDPLEEHDGSRLAQPPTHSALDTLRDQWLAACLKFDEAAAEQLLNQGFSQYSVETVTASVIQNALRDVGDLWERGQASVQQEHFLSALAARRLDALIAASPSPPPSPVALLACAPGEPHSLPVLYLNLLLRRRGRRVVSLGADVPIDELARTARAVDAAIVVLSAQRLVTAAALRDEAALLARKRIPAGFGGRIFVQQPELQQSIAGTYLGDDVNAASDRIHQLLDEPPSVVRRIPPPCGPEAAAFRAAHPRIERYVHQRFSKSPLPSRLLALANNQFGPGLAAALELGDVKYIEADVRWIQAVLMAHGLPVRALRDYLLAYADAVHKVMGASGAEITGWIRGYTARI